MKLQRTAIATVSVPQRTVQPVGDPAESVLAGVLSPATQRAYRSDLCQFFGVSNLSFISYERLDAITPDDVIAWRNELHANGKARSTVNRKLAAIRALYTYLVGCGRLDRNPADASVVRGFREDRRVGGKAMATDDLNRLLSAVRTTPDALQRARDRALILVLVYCGLRRSEATGMDWEQLRQDGVHTVIDLPETKSGVPQDVKAVGPVLDALGAYRDELTVRGRDATGPVFISLANGSEGNGLTPQSVRLIVRRYADRAGIDEASAHTLRHTCCTLAIEGGATPTQVQSHLRHADVKTTLGYFDNRDRLDNNAADHIRIADNG